MLRENVRMQTSFYQREIFKVFKRHYELKKHFSCGRSEVASGIVTSFMSKVFRIDLHKTGIKEKEYKKVDKPFIFFAVIV